ncbi:MAG: phenylalanine--tRNA ligase subunit beta [Firmicutes bacterium]|nr:phenylalanine--tRNA ligase subunit beta [Alicyclobacillaceae bacterium]MCL6498306.1 phenylalanine--tRNA ligase subunit beta [Bacillota bacterium]
MKLSYRWLEQYLPELPPPEEVAEALVRMGLEVAAVVPFGQEWAEVELVELIARHPHPRSDRLWLAEVERGGGQRVTVVTGAPAVPPRTRLWWAPPGTVLADGRRLETVTILGVPSPGMLLAAEELGFVSPEPGLWQWSGPEPVGTRLLAALGGPDWVLDLELTPNLASFAQSVWGVARELAALWDRKLLRPGEPWRFGSAALARVADPADCPAYGVLTVRGPFPMVTPLWMQMRLRAVDQRLTHPAVDATNFLLFDLGQPLHAFDADRLAWPLEVRRARPGERLVTLDGVERELCTEDLVIADRRGPVALAGVMGGAETAVGPKTQRIALESAHFSAARVYRTARRHNLLTEAAQRFGRGTDWQMAPVAAARWVAWVASAEAVEASQWLKAKTSTHRLPWRPDRIRQLLGVTWDDAEMAQGLERLGFAVAGDSVTVPTWRVDIEGEADLAEEVARLKGLDQIPERMPTLPLAVGARHPREALRDAVRQLMVEAGFWEVITRSLTAPEREGELVPDWAPVVVQNPLRDEERQLRRGLLPGLLETLAYNRARTDQPLRLFEVGPVFAWSPEGAREWDEVAAAMALEREAAWPPGTEPSVYDLKGTVEWLSEALGWPLIWSQEGVPPFLHPGRALVVRAGASGEPVGWLGELHPRWADRYQLRRVGVLAVRLMPHGAPSARGKVRPSRYPEVVRDLSLVMRPQGSWSEVAEAVAAALAPDLVRFSPIDRYTGEFGTSITVRFWFQSDTGTLTDAAVEAEMAAIVSKLEQQGYRRREKS